jgi:acetyltransferase-like isoleucine patch superfamily enzyme
MIKSFRNYFFDLFKIDKNKFFHRNIQIDNNVFVDENVLIRIKGTGKISVGEDSELLYGVILMSYFSGNILIGKRCSINPYTIIYGIGDTIIGNDVLIAGHCMIIPNNHNIKFRKVPINKQGHSYKGIIIEDDVWIGHGCSILDGVTIGKGSVIAAGSVVNRTVPPYTVYGGVPAKFVKDR